MICRLCCDQPPPDAALCEECAKHPLLVAAPHWRETIQLAEYVGAVRDAGKVAML
jgi:hypothetical protein